MGTGNLDIIIGTHGLIQDGLDFKNLGLLIIDEEHRFGVRQKEKLKSPAGRGGYPHSYRHAYSTNPEYGDVWHEGPLHYRDATGKTTVDQDLCPAEQRRTDKRSNTAGIDARRAGLLSAQRGAHD